MISGTQELAHINHWPQDIELKRFMKLYTLHFLFHYIFHPYNQQKTNNKYIVIVVVQAEEQEESRFTRR